MAVKVNKLLKDKPQLPDIQLERVHRVRQRNDHHSRPIIARFTRYGDREVVMRNVTKLRGMRIYFYKDLCQALQAIRKAQLPMLKQATSEGKVTYFRHMKLNLKEKPKLDDTTGGIVAGGASTPGGTPARASNRGDAGTSAGSGVAAEQVTPPSEIIFNVSASGAWN